MSASVPALPSAPCRQTAAWYVPGDAACSTTPHAAGSAGAIPATLVTKSSQNQREAEASATPRPRGAEAHIWKAL